MVTTDVRRPLHVVNASWEQDRRPLGIDGFLNTYSRCGTTPDKVGFVVQLSLPVQIETLNRDTVLLIAEANESWEKELAGIAPVTVRRMRGIPVRVEPVMVPESVLIPPRLIDKFTPVQPAPTAVANGVRICIPDPSPDWAEYWRKWLGNDNQQFQIRLLRIVLRGAWILSRPTEEGDAAHALDGAPIAPGVPRRRSGNGIAGTDWDSVIRIQS